MATVSAYLRSAREELWARPMFSFIPDRDLPRPDTIVSPGDGPRVAFTGFPSDFSLSFLLALLDLDVHLCGLVTSPGAHPAIMGDNALSRIAEHLGVPLLRAWRINDEHSRMHLEAMHADAVVMASFDQIVGHRALTVPRHGWLNVHPSFIPEYRGPEPVYWAIAEGSGETGITLHRAVAKVDAGPILAQARVPITRDDTAGSLARKLATTGIELLPDALAALLDGAEGVTPDMSRASYRTSVGHRSLAGAHSAEEALRLIRAGFPNMLPWAHIDGRDLYVSKARIVSDGAADPRKTLRFPDGALEIIAAAERCGCHHDLSDCPHRNTEVANV